MPGGDVQTCDAGCSPAAGEVVQIHTQPVEMVKECPKPHRAKGRLQPEIVERLQNVREALITVLPRVRCDPQHGGAPAGVSRDEWRTLPALFREHLCLFGKFKARQFERLLPNNRQLLKMNVLHASYD